MKMKSLLTGAIVGGIIGGATVLFTTPSSGREIRDSLKNGTKEWEHLLRNVQNRMFDVKSDVLKLVSDSKKATDVIQNQIKPSFHAWKNSIDPQVEQFRKEIQDIQKQFKQLEKTAYQK